MNKLQPYDEYKDSGIEWLGEIPAHWRVRRIKDLSFLQSGDTITSSQLIDEPGYPVYGGNGFRGYFDKYNLEGHYILIGRQGALCGNINYAKGKFWASEHAVVVYIRKGVQILWYGELLRSMNLNQYSLSAAQPGLSIETIRRLKVPIPPLPEQTQIAAYLNRQTSLIGQKISLLQQKIDKYQELKKALINEAVCRGLDKNVPMKDSGVEWIGEVPAHWEVRRVKDSFLLSRGFDLPRDQFQNGKYPVYGSNGIIGYHNQYTTKAPSVTVGRSGSVGEVNYVQEHYWAHNTSLYLWQNNGCNERYIYYLLSSINLKSLSAGSAVGTLNRNYIHELLIGMPEYSEQVEIVNYLDKINTQIDTIIANIQQQIDTLQELRKTLINDVVTGKVRVICNLSKSIR